MAKQTIKRSIETKGNGGELHQVAGDTGRYAQPVINALSELAHEFFR